VVQLGTERCEASVRVDTRNRRVVLRTLRQVPHDPVVPPRHRADRLLGFSCIRKYVVLAPDPRQPFLGRYQARADDQGRNTAVQLGRNGRQEVLRPVKIRIGRVHGKAVTRKARRRSTAIPLEPRGKQWEAILLDWFAPGTHVGPGADLPWRDRKQILVRASMFRVKGAWLAGLRLIHSFSTRLSIGWLPSIASGRHALAACLRLVRSIDCSSLGVITRSFPLR